MIEFDEGGIPVDLTPDSTLVPVPEEKTYQQRLYGALADLADIQAKEGFFLQGQLVEVINKWSTDPPIPADASEDPEGVVVGLDQMKLFHSISHQDNANEEEVESLVLALMKAADETPDFENMDQIDFIILEQEQEMKKKAEGVAYLTACLNGDAKTAHDILDEQGCTLTHLLTQWFVMYMMKHEEVEDHEHPIEAVRRRVGTMGMENAKALSISPGQRREQLEEQIEEWRQRTGFYDEEGEEGDATL